MPRLEQADWWAVRRAQNAKPATYRCPLCGYRLHAMSPHVLIAPEGDTSRRRHAHGQHLAPRRAGEDDDFALLWDSANSVYQVAEWLEESLVVIYRNREHCRTQTTRQQKPFHLWRDYRPEANPWMPDYIALLLGSNVENLSQKDNFKT